VKLRNVLSLLFQTLTQNKKVYYISALEFKLVGQFTTMYFLYRMLPLKYQQFCFQTDNSQNLHIIQIYYDVFTAYPASLAAVSPALGLALYLQP